MTKKDSGVFVDNALTFQMGEVTKHAGGRPKKFASRLHLIAAIQEYFNACDNRKQVVFSQRSGRKVSIPSPAPYTMSGMARYIGVDRDTILRYGKDEEFYGIIKAARAKVEEDNETRLLETSNQSGAIFALKNNHGWVDQSEVKNEHKMVEFVNDVPRPDADTIEA